MGVQRSNRHKRTKTGAKKGIHNKKRKYNLTRPPANTKIGEPKIREVRVRGGNTKDRALRLNTGNFTMLSNNATFNLKIEQVMYHPTNTELMRTNTLTKGSIVKLHCDEDFTKIEKQSDTLFNDLLDKKLVYGIITTRPGQEGRADGHVLQGKELEFYFARFKKRKAK